VGVASLGEIAVWSFFQPMGTPSLPALLARWMAQYRFEEAQGATFALLGLAVALLLATRRGLRGAI
jgi:ABC-type Fe3+ transport system permease subunit